MKKSYLFTVAAVGVALVGTAVAGARVYAAVSQASTDVPQALPDGSTAGINSTLNFSVNGTITDANLQFSVTHTWDSDVLVKLTGGGPTTATATLIQNCGGSGDNFTNTVIDDEAAATLACAGIAGVPYTGTFKSPLSATAMTAFDGKTSGGTWTLNVADDSSICTGTLTAWSLTLDGSAPLPVELMKFEVK